MREVARACAVGPRAGPQCWSPADSLVGVCWNGRESPVAGARTHGDRWPGCGVRHDSRLSCTVKAGAARRWIDFRRRHDSSDAASRRESTGTGCGQNRHRPAIRKTGDVGVESGFSSQIKQVAFARAAQPRGLRSKGRVRR
jgi:hypothetical protein